MKVSMKSALSLSLGPLQYSGPNSTGTVVAWKS